jgi:LPXTG-site transpeptidase (sortase) family protein
MARLSAVLIIGGLLVLAYAAAWQLGWAPGSRVTLPVPVALSRPTPTTVVVLEQPGSTSPTALPTTLPTTSPTAPPAAQPTVVPTVTTVQTAAPTVEPARAADADDRVLPPPEPGYAVRLAIPSIKLETVVEQGGIIADADGQPIWQTLPFVAVHYGHDTSPLGVPGNAVIAGHVVTLSEGNVFRFLYQLDFDDEIMVWDQLDREHDFKVVDVKLVPPSDTSVMAATADETLTLITCGGTFDPIKREFSERLIVTAKPG